VEAGRRAERSGAIAEAIGAYETAADLYRGDLLEGEPDAEWCSLEREHLREVLLDVLTALAGLHAREGNFDRTIAFCRRALRVDPIREEVHRRLVEALWRAGRRDEALRQYRTCREILRQELGVAPLPETERLAERVRAGPAPRDGGRRV
ncbi:MAG TPA: bacterial transcriptional activator domain-containing protein, partial [Thermodesulfobacteriota bacterium]